ncbi:hypothetical protein AB0B89_31485 [Sphaerisporangium sp. NPDC049002]|uniref:hypothetical protein n=1 Tax=unclassified Sphaerisporangium TaxID=2630420 RepID=UPI0033DC9FC3
MTNPAASLVNSLFTAKASAAAAALACSVAIGGLTALASGTTWDTASRVSATGTTWDSPPAGTTGTTWDSAPALTA